MKYFLEIHTDIRHPTNTTYIKKKSPGKNLTSDNALYSYFILFINNVWISFDKIRDNKLSVN